MPEISGGTSFQRAKALLGDDYVVLERHALLDLIQWVSMQPRRSLLTTEDSFAMWVADYNKRRFTTPSPLNRAIKRLPDADLSGGISPRRIEGW